jgi:hypothetical protein
MYEEDKESQNKEIIYVGGKHRQLELEMKAEPLGITFKEVKKIEDEQFINLVSLMRSVSHNKAITCDKKVIEIEEKFEEEVAIPKVKPSKPEYDMELYSSYQDCQTKFRNDDRIRIFRDVLDTDLNDMKIVKMLKPYFKVSMPRVDSKRIKVFISGNKMN